MTTPPKTPFFIFLQNTTISVAAALAAVLLYHFFFFSPYSSEIVGESPALYHAQKISFLEKEQMYIIADTTGIRAVSAICTHRHCLLQYTNNGFACGCHDGRFQADGTPASGPVTKPLEHYRVYRNRDNRLVIDPTQIVPAEFRCSEQ